MAYLAEFKKRIEDEDFSGLLKIWEEYTNGDAADPKEFCQILEQIKESQFAEPFGPYVETALPLWSQISDQDKTFIALKHLIDLQTTNSKLLGDIAYKALHKRFGDQSHFAKWIKLVGLRNFDKFQNAVSNLELLAHMQKGKFVFHKGGWGTGEIIDVSMILEQVSVEFENVNRRRDLSFENAFKTLVPLADDHFLALRFGNPDKLEDEARKKPEEVLKHFLRDMGPKTAAEIKDEMCDLVIPEEDWAKWWQLVRTRAKKDTMLEVPSSLKDPFRLRETEVTHEERLHKDIHSATEINEVIQTTYNYIRDFPNILKKEEVKNSIREKLIVLFEEPDLKPHQELELTIFLEQYFSEKIEGKNSVELLRKADNVIDLIDLIKVQAFKKKALEKIKKYFDNWVGLFLEILFILEQNSLRDYLLKELNSEPSAKESLQNKLDKLCRTSQKHPELFVWYFQKIMTTQGIPYADKAGQFRFMEEFLILYSQIEYDPEYRDLVKKMYQLLSGKRFSIVRSVLDGSTREFVHEFLLLVSKCGTLSDHDISILRSLAQVVYPDIIKTEQKTGEQAIWTTEKGFLKAQEKAQKVGTVDIVENAKEIEAARALGDLRENSEYKSALERRSRLQSELKTLSDQLSKSRIITPDDISTIETSIGTVVDIVASDGKLETYKILGPWDADPNNNILSFQSKLAQSMLGLRQGDTFTFRDKEYKVSRIRSYLEV